MILHRNCAILYKYAPKIREIWSFMDLGKDIDQGEVMVDIVTEVR